MRPKNAKHRNSSNLVGDNTNNGCINKICARLGKTRGAFGFALIFLWFLSLYQDKERNDNPITFEISNRSIVEMINVKQKNSSNLVGDNTNNGCINKICARLGKTRGAIGFALIFLWFLSLYQDKERNDNPVSFEIIKGSIVEMINVKQKNSSNLVGDNTNNG